MDVGNTAAKAQVPPNAARTAVQRRIMVAAATVGPHMERGVPLPPMAAGITVAELPPMAAERHRTEVAGTRRADLARADIPVAGTVGAGMLHPVAAEGTRRLAAEAVPAAGTEAGTECQESN